MMVPRPAKSRPEQNPAHPFPQETALGTSVYRLTCPTCDADLLSLTAVWDLAGAAAPAKGGLDATHSEA